MRRPASQELPRLRDLPPGEDLVGVAELVQAAAPLPDLEADARQRIRASLRRDMAATDTRRPRWAFRLSPVMVVLVALISASVVGAAVRSLLVERRLQRREDGPARVSVVDVGPRKSPRRSPAPVSVPPLAPVEAIPHPPPAPLALERPAVTKGSAVVQRVRTPAPPPPVEETTPSAPAAEPPSPPVGTAAPTSPPPMTFAAPPLPAPRPEQRPPTLALATPRKTGLAPVAPRPPSPPDADLLAQAIRTLRRNGDANGALALLAPHQQRLATGPLAPEAAAVRIEALLQVRRTSAALFELDRFPLDDVPGHEEWRIVRAELRGQAGRWAEAERDFTVALTGAPGAPGHVRDELVERALWGRAGARARQGNTAGAHADQALYLQRFPDGRFATQARRALSGSGPSEPRAP